MMSKKQLFNKFEDEGFLCQVIVGTIGSGDANKESAPILFSFAGVADDKITGRIYREKNGLKFISKSCPNIEIKILWEDIKHVYYENASNKISVFITFEDAIIFKKLNSYEMKIALDVINQETEGIKIQNED
jgi:hypothetical protein